MNCQRWRRHLAAMTAVLATAVTFALPAMAASDAQRTTRVPRAERTRVVLIDRGAAPREPLRLSLTEGPGRPVEATMHYDVSSDSSALGLTRAPVRLVVETTVTRVTPRGGGTYTTRWRSADVVDDGSLHADELADVRQRLDEMSNVAFTAVVNNRNELLEARSLGSSRGYRRASELLRQVVDQSPALTAPFPSQPVGIGSRWRVEVAPRVWDLDVTTSSVVELVERRSDLVVLRIESDAVAHPQAIDLPRVPSDARSSLVWMRTHATGTSTVDLTGGAPVDGRASGESSSVWVVDLWGDTYRFESASTHETTIRPLG